MTEKIDENVLSRQLFTIGKDAQMKIMNTKVLINGLNGLGSEIAKNIILMSVKSVGLLDNRIVEEKDLGTNFFLRKEHIGKGISESCVSSFQELNNTLKVTVETRELSNEEVYKEYDILVDCMIHSKKEAIEINEYCRKNNVNYVNAINRGVFSMIFNDFGDDFIVYDTNGETPKTFVISGMMGNTFMLTDDTFCDLQEGDTIKFEEVIGLEELNYKTNGEKTFTITKRTGSSIEIGDITQFSKGKYVKGGIITEMKTPIHFHMKSYKERLENAGEITFTNSMKFDRLYGIHGLFHSLMIFIERYNRTPKTHCEEDYHFFETIVKELGVEVDEKISKIFCYGNNGFLSPLDTTIGGIAAQEVLKAASGKYTPYNQFMVYDCVEILPETYLELPKEEFEDTGRYSGQIELIGKTNQKKLQDSSLFLIGAGAIGCEVLKTWAMMGIATGEGMIHVTDNDCIEKSNLSRQFLFRNKHVGQSKSSTATHAIREMNPSIHITDYTLRVGESTENIYNKEFYSKLTAVTTALDNVKARMYVDSQCLKYKVPMIEAGTTGTKGNTQSIIPYLTMSYSTGSIRDPEEKTIPMCTLHNFPNVIDHTIQWARDRFEGWFKNEIEPVKCYKEQGEKYLESLKSQGISNLQQTLEIIIENSITNKPKTLKDCIRWIKDKYDTNYVCEITKLITLNPEDSVTDEGIPFWHAPKRFPHVVHLSRENEMAKQFIVTGTYLRASIYDIPIDMNEEEIISYALSLEEKQYIPTKINFDESMTDVIQLIEDYKQQLSTIEIPLVKPVEFEKDDDTNHHIAFITSCSNLRAENYCIEPADFMKTKLIAGKIIPAMITTTAVVSGLQCIEFIKVIQKKPLEQYHNSYLNLAIGYMDGTEPEAVKREEVCPGVVTSIWEDLSFTVSKEITIEELIDVFDKKYPYHLESISIDGKMIYAEFLPSGASRLSKKIKDLYNEIVGKEIIDSILIVPTVTSKDGEKELDEDFNFPEFYLNF